MKPGYKQTEVGVIPEDWEVKSLGELANLNQPQTISAKEFTDYGYPVYGANGVVGYYHRTNHQTSQVTVTCRGSTCGTVNRTVDECWITGNAMVLNCDHNKELSKDFFYYLLLAQDMSDCITGTGQPQIVRSALAAFRVGLPKQPLEQHAIAEALSDVDGLLGGLDRLIAKKRDLKQAAMQQLLTGQTRLPGFFGDWKVRRLGDIALIKTGTRNNEDKIEDGLYPFYVRSDVLEQIDTYSHDCEAILVPGEGRIGSIFHYVNGRFDVHQRVYAITQFKPDMCARFVHAYMTMQFGAWAMQNTVKATVDSLRLPTFQSFEMRVPPTKDEQTGIANVLSDMSDELSALEARRDKTGALKQAMMQQLLTGRTRLVVAFMA